MTKVRAEKPEDAAAIRAVLIDAFSTTGEAELVERLRASGNLGPALVAEEDGTIVGHVAFSPVNAEGSNGLGLAPVAVRSDCQGRGLGSRLITEGLAACWQRGAPYVTVLGNQGYYAKFGFQAASKWKLANEYGAGPEFMLVAGRAGALPGHGAVVKYGREFSEL